MSGVTVSWDETAPADSRNAGLGAMDIRSIQTNLRGALDAEHLHPSSGGYAGVHRAGAARTFVAASSALSSADTTGRLMWTTDHLQLWYVGSEATEFIGGRQVPQFHRFMPAGGLLAPSGASQIVFVSGEAGFLSGVTSEGILPFGVTLAPLIGFNVNTHASGGSHYQVNTVHSAATLIGRSLSGISLSVSFAGNRQTPDSAVTVSWMAWGMLVKDANRGF